MRKFIDHVAIFFLIIAIVLLMIELFIRYIPNDYSYKNEYLAKNASEIQIMSMGSSHGVYAIDPSYFKRSGFNASHVSQSLEYDYKIWNKFKESLINLDTLILPISYFSLFSNLEDGSEAWRAKNYSIYYKIGSKRIKDTMEIFNQSPISLFKIIAKAARGVTNLTVSELGASKVYKSQSDLISSGLAAAKRHTEKDFSRLEENLGYIKSIIDDCASRGINVLLVTTPTTAYYWKNLDEKQLQLMKSALTTLVQVNPNVEYLDLLKDGRFEDSDFRDADHLNPKGAEKFTKIIDKAIM